MRHPLSSVNNFVGNIKCTCSVISRYLIAYSFIVAIFIYFAMSKAGGNFDVDSVDNASSLSKFRKLKHELMGDLKSFNTNSFPQ